MNLKNPILRAQKRASVENGGNPHPRLGFVDSWVKGASVFNLNGHILLRFAIFIREIRKRSRQ